MAKPGEGKVDPREVQLNEARAGVELGIPFSIVFFVAIYFTSDYDHKIIEITNDQSETKLVKKSYYSGVLINETELNSDSLFHGKSFDYSDGKLTRIGFWYNGKWDSTWTRYDHTGNITGIEVFDKGKFLYRNELTDTGFVNIDYDALSFIEKKIMDTHFEGPPQGVSKRNR